MIGEEELEEKMNKIEHALPQSTTWERWHVEICMGGGGGGRGGGVFLLAQGGGVRGRRLHGWGEGRGRTVQEEVMSYVFLQAESWPYGRACKKVVC